MKFSLNMIMCLLLVTFCPWSNIFQFGSFLAKKQKQNALCKRSRKVKLRGNVLLCN